MTDPTFASVSQHALDLLDTLAQKLGTTAEHLWVVLCRQAPVSAGAELFMILLMAALAATMINRAMAYNKKLATLRRESSYKGIVDDQALALGLLVGASIITTLATLVTCAVCCTDIAAGFFNPEYWALDKVLTTIRGR